MLISGVKIQHLDKTLRVLVLYWDSTYAIAMALLEIYPSLNPQEIGLARLENLVQNLPDFLDDPTLVTERMLQDIQITWYEEYTEK